MGRIEAQKFSSSFDLCKTKSWSQPETQSPRYLVSAFKTIWYDRKLQPLQIDYCSKKRKLTIMFLPQKYFYSLSEERKAEYKPCCAPTTFSSLQLLYMETNDTVTQKTLPNMVVESCGCMWCHFEDVAVATDSNIFAKERKCYVKRCHV